MLMEVVSTAISWIEAHPVVGGGIVTIIIGIGAYFTLKIIGLIFSKKTKPYIDPVFYSFRKKYVVVAVHEYIPSDHPSGYRQIQHSRPEQWSKLINIKTSLFGLRHRVMPVDSSAHLAVVIRPNKDGGEKTVLFNR